MARGGFYSGSDWIPYNSGYLSKSTATSVQEFTKQETIKCIKCNNVVPLKDKCIFCGEDLTKVKIADNNENIKKMDIDISKKYEGLDKESSVIYTNQVRIPGLNNNVKNTNNLKSKFLFDINFSDETLFHLFKNNFNKSDYIKWDMECIPKSFNSKLLRFFDDFHNICFSRLQIDENESLYYFGNKSERVPLLILVFNKKTIKSNFKLYKKEVLILLKITKNRNKILERFKLRYASKNKKANLYYLSLGNIDTDKIFDNLEILISKFGDFIVNPLLKNYEFYKKLDINDLLING